MENNKNQNIEKSKKLDSEILNGGNEEMKTENINNVKKEEKTEEQKKEKAYLYKEDKKMEAEVKKMSVRERLARARLEVNDYIETKSGLNDEDAFNYFELKDFMPIINNVFLKYRLIGVFSFPDNTQSKLVISDFDSDEGSVEFTMCRVQVKGFGNAMQAEGATNTYSKRYLYMNALEICDKDKFDAPKKKAKGIEHNNNPEPLANMINNNQIKLITTKTTELMKNKNIEKDVRALMKNEGFNSLSEITKCSEIKASAIIQKLATLEEKSARIAQEQELEKRRQKQMANETIQDDFMAGDVVELPEGEIGISEESIGEMEF